MKKCLFVALVSTVLSANLYANDFIAVEDVTYQGNACQPGSITVERVAENGKLRFQFNPMAAEAGEKMNRSVDLQTCEIQVPVRGVEGYRVALLPLQFTGKFSLPYGTQSQLYVNTYYEYFYGTAQQNFRGTWFGEQVNDFSLVSPKAGTAPFWSNCGEDFKLRLNFTLRAQTNKFGHQAKLAIEQLAGFGLQVEACH